MRLCPALYVGPGDSNLGPPATMASVLPAEYLGPQLLLSVISVLLTFLDLQRGQAAALWPLLGPELMGKLAPGPVLLLPREHICTQTLLSCLGCPPRTALETSQHRECPWEGHIF